MGSLCEIVTSSKKPEVHNVYRNVARERPSHGHRQHAQNFGRVVFQISDNRQTDRQTDKQTNKHSTGRQTDTPISSNYTRVLDRKFMGAAILDFSDGQTRAWLARRHSVVNVKNYGPEDCFRWAIISALFPTTPIAILLGTKY